jgi:hypothetical protein
MRFGLLDEHFLQKTKKSLIIFEDGHAKVWCEFFRLVLLTRGLQQAKYV